MIAESCGECTLYTVQYIPLLYKYMCTLWPRKLVPTNVYTCTLWPERWPWCTRVHYDLEGDPDVHVYMHYDLECNPGVHVYCVHSDPGVVIEPGAANVYTVLVYSMTWKVTLV